MDSRRFVWTNLTSQRCHPYRQIYHKRYWFSYISCWIGLNCLDDFGMIWLWPRGVDDRWYNGGEKIVDFKICSLDERECCLQSQIITTKLLISQKLSFYVYTKIEPPKTNTMYHMHTLGASKCMHVVHSVDFVIADGFGWFYLNTRGWSGNLKMLAIPDVPNKVSCSFLHSVSSSYLLTNTIDFQKKWSIIVVDCCKYCIHF